MPMIPSKRGVSRARYEIMVRDALSTYNQNVMSLNAINRLEGLAHRLLKPLMTEAEAFNSRKRDSSLIRFRIFRELHAMGFSLPSLGKMAGFDHTTILSGIRRINQSEPLAVGINEMTERPACHAAARKYVAMTSSTERTANNDQAPALIEVPMMAIAS